MDKKQEVLQSFKNAMQSNKFSLISDYLETNVHVFEEREIPSTVKLRALNESLIEGLKLIFTGESKCVTTTEKDKEFYTFYNDGVKIFEYGIELS